MSFAENDRHALADQLAAGGPDAPTLCEGWAAADLAAHLVLREAPVDVALGALPLPPLRRRRDEARRQVEATAFATLVDTFRAGPPPRSVFAVPGADAGFNVVEHFVHLEDLRRAGEDPAEPRELPRAHQQALWRGALVTAAAVYRRAPVGVTLASTLGPRRTVRRAPGGGGTSVVLRGEPGELLLHTMGRDAVARVDVSGPKEAVRRLSEVPRSV